MTNKIHKYNFLIVGGGLIGALAGLQLRKKVIKF
jgi:2-polyprenyl-6-methoxyphenol hydroxylase-like FAD-dependent oxidoreductase